VTGAGDLNAALLRAHGAGDAAQLSGLYRQAGEDERARGCLDAACFFLTQAYIFALEAGLPDAGEIHAILKFHGREA
jgi:hypothetical protein